MPIARPWRFAVLATLVVPVAAAMLAWCAEARAGDGPRAAGAAADEAPHDGPGNGNPPGQDGDPAGGTDGGDQPEQSGQPEPPGLADSFRAGAAALVKGEWDAAESALRYCLTGWPDHPDVLALLGLALHGQKRFDEALAALEKAIAGPTRYLPRALYYAGLCQSQLGRPDDARGSFLQVLTDHPDSEPAKQISAEFGADLSGLPRPGSTAGPDTPPDNPGAATGGSAGPDGGNGAGVGETGAPGAGTPGTAAAGQKPEPEWRVQASLGSAVDTSPGQSQDLETLTGTGRDADGYWSAGLKAGFEPRGVPFQAALLATHLDYFTADPTDYSELGLQLGGDIALGENLALSPAGSISVSWVSDEPWETGLALGATLTGIEGAHFAYTIALSGGWADHTTTYHRYDGGYLDGSVTGIWLQPDGAFLSRGSVAFSYSLRTARQPDLGYQLAGLSGSISLRLDRRLSLDAFMALRWQPFLGDDISTGERRMDLRWSTGVTLAWEPLPWLTVAADVSVFANGSTIGRFVYERFVAGVSVSVLFPSTDDGAGAGSSAASGTSGQDGS